MTSKDYISVASHNKPNIFCNFDSDLKQFIIKYEHFVQGQLHFTKNKIIQQKLLESDLQHELWFEITFTLKSQIYKKKKKFSPGLAVVLLSSPVWPTLTHVRCPSLKLRMDV